MTESTQILPDIASATTTTTVEENMIFSHLSRIPVIVILGATATGKSKLAINLAKKFNGEIVSADSMQVYRGLDVLTNKITLEEMDGVTHHMIGIADTNNKYDVVRFQTEAVPIVDKIILDGKIPFLVGGTNYYIESLLWKVLLQEKNESHATKRKTEDGQDESSCAKEDCTFENNEILKFMSSQSYALSDEDSDTCKWSSQDLYCALRLVDPDRAGKLHPNDRRKVFRSLQVRFQTGKKHSQLIEEQQKETIALKPSESDIDFNQLKNYHLGGPLRYPNSFCLWIQAPKAMLDERINARVEDMIENGLQRELNDYIDKLNQEGCQKLDFTRGLLQSIGFKEFQDYLQLSPNLRDSEEGKKLFESGKELLKIATRQYAKRQLKWVKQRFLRSSRRQIPPVYWLDGSLVDAESWKRNVESIAETIVEAHLLNQTELVPLLKERLVPQIKDEGDDLIARTCNVCTGRVFVGIVQWNQHLKSSRHKKMVSKINKTREKMPAAVVDS